MLTKIVKNVRSLHDDYFITEKRIAREIGRLQKKARTDFKKMLRKRHPHAAVKFSSLHSSAYTKEWNPTIYVYLANDRLNLEEFKQFCLFASEKIGISFEFSSNLDEN